MTDTIHDIAYTDDFYFTEPRFLEAFYEFGARFNSLVRFYMINVRAKHSYLDELAALKEKVLTSDDIYRNESSDAIGDVLISDKKYLNDTIVSAVISHAFALLETLYNCVCSEIAQERSVTFKLSKRALPHIDKCIEFLHACNFIITLDSKTSNDLKLCRLVRNNYIHQLGQKTPKISQIEATEQIDLNKYIAELCLKTLANAAKILEINYWSEKYPDEYN